jgi:hypothetical protein
MRLDSAGSEYGRTKVFCESDNEFFLQAMKEVSILWIKLFIYIMLSLYNILLLVYLMKPFHYIGSIPLYLGKELRYTGGLVGPKSDLDVTLKRKFPVPTGTEPSL